MKRTHKLLVSTLFVASASMTSVAQAEGFFGKLFGSSSAGADFKTLMSHVPADTSFMFANKNPIPEKVMDFHIKRGQDMMEMVSKLDKDNKNDKKLKGADAFLKALFEDLGDKLTKGKIEDTGLSLKATTVVYGYNTVPVMRLTFADKEKLMTTLQNAEKKSSYKIDLTKCGDFECFVAPENDNKSAAFVILDDHLAASIFSADQKDKMIEHLIGKSDPKESFKEGKWDDFLKENGYTGYGDGFVNLLELYNKSKSLIEEGINQVSKGKDDAKQNKACMAVAQDHLKNVPEILFGTKTLEEKKMDYEVVVKTSSDISEVLQGIANKANIAQRVESPILDMGLNINLMKLRDALTQYSNFLVKSGETHKCKSIDPKAVRKGMGGMMMAMNMGLTQLKSLYLGVADIELDERMQPKNVDAYISIGADDPAGLIGMVGMMSPALMGFQVPADGSAVKLPAGAIPSRGMSVPPIYLSRTAKTLNIMVGNDKPKLKDYKSDAPEIMSFAVDGKRYYEKLAQVMKAIPQAKGKNADQEQVAKMMETMGSMSGTVNQIIRADKRGLVIDYHMKY